MESILSATATPFYKFSPNSSESTRGNLFSTRPSRLASLRISRPLVSISFPSISRGDSSTPAASAGGGGADMSESLVDTIVLNVRGMACEGCVTSVKNILESQPQVSSATVDLAKARAIIYPVVEAKAITDLGENLAKHLTSCGFDSNIQRDT